MQTSISLKWKPNLPHVQQEGFTCIFYACPGYLQIWQRSDLKWLRKDWDTIFPIVREKEILVAMTTTFFIQSAPKPNAGFPDPIDATYKIW